ncbi:aldose 1-epimerase [Pygocentrus nattereri]|uniref:Aldose 1-epimerase n=1 Tax=Pygocentrus nattereri TaxID=42514 RepID=A0A3B4DI43_PYGNA|nr:aldose 1-epimerase [Pygocentrus nattereri]XP_017580017.1 aldose 1-epimerase [Pygocentrus nattereri]
MCEVKREALSLESAQRSVEKWTLRSQSVSVEIISLGAVITSIKTLDRSGHTADIVLGFDDLGSYLTNPRYFGAVVGRVANRIAKGQFVIEGKVYKLAINNGPNALHGGLKGFDKYVWTCEAVENGVRLSHSSAEGDEGYPGNLKVSVTYTLEENILTVQYSAQTDQTTPVNLTNHSYFNLAGQGTPDIYDHEVTISAEAYLPVDDTMIPTGEIRPVENSLFDLRKPVLLGPRLKELPGPGFDHNFCLWVPGQPKLERKCARVVHPGTGRVLEVSTTQPGVQFYTSNFLDGSLGGKGGTSYPKHSAFCLETQNWPDAVNQPQFPESLLRPGEEYMHTTRFTFSVA